MKRIAAALLLFLCVGLNVKAAAPQLLLLGVGNRGGSLPGGTFSLIQHVSNTSCSGTTCALTLTGTTAANNLLVYCAISENRVDIGSADKGGTIARNASAYVYSFYGAGNGMGHQSCAYVLPSASSAATTPITVTFTGDVGGWGALYLREYHPSANFANVGLEGAGATAFPPGVAVTGSSFTWTGTNANQTYVCASQVNCDGVNAPYNTGADLSTFWAGAGLPTPASGTGPTFTLTGGTGQTQTAGLAFSFNPAACSPQSFVDFQVGLPGNGVTEAGLRASTRGWSGGIWTVTTSGAAVPLTFETTASMPLQTATPRLCGDGVTYAAGVGTLGLQYAGDGTTDLSYVQYEVGPAPNNGTLSILISYWSDLVPADTSNYDMVTIYGNLTTDFLNIKDKTDGAGGRAFETEAPAPAAPVVIPHLSSTQYWLYLEFTNSGNNIFRAYDTAGTLIGSASIAAVNSNFPSRIIFGKSNNSSAVTAGKITRFDSLRINLTGSAMTP